MYKIILIGLIGLFLSSGALFYNNGNLSLSIDMAKKTLFDTLNSIEQAIEE